MEGDQELRGDGIISLFRKILGEKNVIIERQDLLAYSSDESPYENRYLPAVAVRPGSTDEVARILKIASEHKIPVIPRGSGTGLVGGVLPVKGGIVLSLERMNRILEIDEINQVAVVEAGVRLDTLKEEVQVKGLYFPVHPGELNATIGGSLATNAGGMNAVKYGVMRHHVLGIEAVLPNGEIIKCGGKYVKSSTGYDLTRLIVGSEGTLAVITRSILKLSPNPLLKEIMFVPFNNLQEAIDTVPDILKLEEYPDGLEFIEKNIIDIVEKFTGKEIPYHEYPSFLLIFKEGKGRDDILEYFAKVENICLKHGAPVAMVPDSGRARKKIIEMREKFYPALKKYAPMDVVDIVVPRSEIARFVHRVKEISDYFKIPVIAYGHAGDGNVHLHPLCVNMEKQEWLGKLPSLLDQIYRAGIEFGGAISGEHGIGFLKKSYLKLQFSPEQIDLFKRIKRAFDPDNIMNPGKIFDLL